MPDTEALMVDVISDFVCPWCWIGKRGVDELMRSRKVVRVWRPYFLHPNLPPEGMDRAATDAHEVRAGGGTREWAMRSPPPDARWTSISDSTE